MKHKTVITTGLIGMVICLFFLLSGCATKEVYSPVCRHSAVYAALTAGDLGDVQTRVAVGRSKVQGVNHAQAQAKIDGKWRWLSFDGSGDVVATDWSDSQFATPSGMSYVTTQNFMRVLDRNNFIPGE